MSYDTNIILAGLVIKIKIDIINKLGYKKYDLDIERATVYFKQRETLRLNLLVVIICYVILY